MILQDKKAIYSSVGMGFQEPNYIKGVPMQFKSLMSLLPEERHEILPYFSGPSEKCLFTMNLRGKSIL